MTLFQAEFKSFLRLFFVDVTDDGLGICIEKCCFPDQSSVESYLHGFSAPVGAVHGMMPGLAPTQKLAIRWRINRVGFTAKRRGTCLSNKTMSDAPQCRIGHYLVSCATYMQHLASLRFLVRTSDHHFNRRTFSKSIREISRSARSAQNGRVVRAPIEWW